MICKLPQNLYALILSQLELPTLSNTLLVNKRCYKNSKAFWIQKILKEFPSLKERKPADITSYEWYKRLVTSGDLYRYGKPEILAKNVVKCFIQYYHGLSVYYIDIFNDLYWIKYSKKVATPQTSLKMRDIKDMMTGETAYGLIQAFITTQGNLWIYTERSNTLMEAGKNVKKVVGHGNTLDSTDIAIITENDDLYLVDFYTFESKKIASNVKSADWANIPYVEHATEYAAIYYVNQVGELWEYYPTYSREYDDERPPNEKNYEYYKYNKLIDGGCKSIRVTDHCLLILTLTDHLLIYSRLEFHPEEADGEYPDASTTQKAKNASAWYQQHPFKQVSRVLDMVYLVDFQHNFYIVKDTSIWNTPLTVMDTNVLLSCHDQHGETEVYLVKYRK